MNSDSTAVLSKSSPGHVPAEWPLSEYSSMHLSSRVTWHVQQLGEGSTVVLIHGTGASTHSWRDVATELAKTHRVVMFDLPGHGFTSRPANSMMSLNGMTRLIEDLLQDLNIQPDFIVGHSAGAAIACQLAVNSNIAVRSVVSLNGALQPFEGVAGQVFAPIAQLLAVNPVVPKLVSWRARKSTLANKLLKDTGSQIDAEGRQLYTRLLRKPAHVAGALCMMANWELVPLARQLPKFKVPLHLIVGSNDRTIPPEQSRQVASRVGTATLTEMKNLGHLAHEESPVDTCNILREFFARSSIDRKLT